MAPATGTTTDPAPAARGAGPGLGTSTKEFAQYQQRAARRTTARRITRGIAGALIVLAAWQLASTLYDLELVLPPPTRVIGELFRMLTLSVDPWPYRGGNIYQNAGASLLRALIGFALGVVLAVPLGLLIGKSTVAREFFAPVLSALYPIPGSAWIPLAFLWFGLNDLSVLFVVFISVFFPMYYNTEAGVRAINPLLIEAGYCFGARRLRLMTRVILPGTMPFVVSGLRIGVGSAWRVLVVAEILVGSSGLGYMLTQSQYFFRSDDLLAVMIVIAIVGYFTEKLLVNTVEKRTTARWERQATAARRP
jgi:ABC-type nitrate/sulfonate/bicarbonate transport system permease component